MLIGLMKGVQKIIKIFIPVILFYGKKIFVWGLHDDFYTHCYFLKLFLLEKGIMCMFRGCLKCVGFVCVLFESV